MGCGVGESGRRGQDILRNIVVVYQSDLLLCSLRDASMIRKLYKLHLVLELSSSPVTPCRDWVIRESGLCLGYIDVSSYKP